MLVSPARNHSSSWMIAFSGSFLVVSIGKPAARSKRIWWPNTDSVPVPVRSCFSAPSRGYVRAGRDTGSCVRSSSAARARARAAISRPAGHANLRRQIIPGKCAPSADKRQGRTCAPPLSTIDQRVRAYFARLQHRRPLGDFALHQRAQRSRRAVFAASECTLPRSSRRLRTFSSSSALATAAFSLATIAAGVPFGAKIAFQAEAW